MNTKIKSALLLLAMLFIGIIAGVMGSRLYLEHRMQKFRSQRGEHFMQQRLKQLMEPTPEQEAALDSILEKYQPRFHELSMQFRGQSRMLLDSLHKELEPLLTKEQKKRFDEQRMMRPFNRPFGRPDGEHRMGKPLRPRMRPDDRSAPPHQ